MNPARFRYPTPLALLALAQVGHAQTDLFDDNPFPHLLAGFVTLALTEEISTATFDVDNGGGGASDTRFRTLRLPWHHEFDVGERAQALRVEAVLGIVSADDGVELSTPSGLAAVDEDWSAFGARVGVGWNHPLGRGWRVRPGVGLGLSYLENSATYNAAGTSELAPLLDGVFVNWDAWALTTSATLTLELPRERDHLAVGAIGTYALSSTDIFEATSDLQEGSDSSRNFLVRADVGAPWVALGEDAAWDAFAGYAHFDASAADLLGFDELFEFGAGVTFRVLEKLPPIRVGAAWIEGEDVSGWSLGFSLAP